MYYLYIGVKISSVCYIFRLHFDTLHVNISPGWLPVWGLLYDMFSRRSEVQVITESSEVVLLFVFLRPLLFVFILAVVDLTFIVDCFVTVLVCVSDIVAIEQDNASIYASLKWDNASLNCFRFCCKILHECHSKLQIGVFLWRLFNVVLKRGPPQSSHLMSKLIIVLHL